MATWFRLTAASGVVTAALLARLRGLFLLIACTKPVVTDTMLVVGSTTGVTQAASFSMWPSIAIDFKLEPGDIPSEPI
jgi:hypothetical protein